MENTSQASSMPDDKTATRNTLQWNENTGTSGNRAITQLDIEHSDRYMDDDDELGDLPPLSAYLSGWKFWCQFAMWPSVFLILNAVVVSTLIAFSEFEFQYGQRHSKKRYYDVETMDNREMQNVSYEMTKYNRMIIAVLLSIDALVVCRAVIYLEKKVRELDMMGETNHDDQFPSTSTNSTKPNVHAQVSRKLDTVLGRNPQSRVSILVSLLWLLLVACGTVGLVSVADLLFAISPKGKQVCTGQRPASSPSGGYYYNASDDEFNREDDLVSNNDEVDDRAYNKTKRKHIDNIPNELQEWAQAYHSMYTDQQSVVHFTNGVNYFAASNPLINKTSDTSHERHEGTHLVAIGADGNIAFFENVANPRQLTSISGDNSLNSTGFCCIYSQPDSKSHESYGLTQSASLLCTLSSDTITNGEFPNTTIYTPSKHGDDSYEYFGGASMKAYNNEIWVQVMVSKQSPKGYEDIMTFYTAHLENSKLQVLKIVDWAYSSNEESSIEDNPLFVGPGSHCYRWTKNIDAIVLVLVLGTSSAWLVTIKKLSVGIVPAVVAISMSLTSIDHGLGLAMSWLAALAAFFGLLGCIPIPLQRETLIWSMYTLLFCVAGMIFAGSFYMYYDSVHNFERAFVTITFVSLVGFILNHPVLYLLGWTGGIWAIFCGIFLIVTPPHRAGFFAISLGIIMGSGCVTVGFNLIKYRAHIVYYSRRAWNATNAAMQSNSNYRDGRNNIHQHGSNASTTRTTRHIPVVDTSQDTQVCQTGGNDITTGLLHQN